MNSFSDDELVEIVVEKCYGTEEWQGKKICSADAWYHFCHFIIHEDTITAQKIWNKFVEEVFSMVEKNTQTCFMASRGLGKSFLMFVLYPLFKTFLFSNTDVVIVTNIPKMARRNLRVFKRIVDNNELLLEKKDMSNMRDLKWGDKEVVYNNGFIETLSIGTTPRSAHVPLVIVDDPLRDDNKYSNEHIFDFVRGQLLPCIKRLKGRMIVNGTPQDTADIFHRLMNAEADGDGAIIKNGGVSALGFYSKVFPAITDMETKQVYLEEVYSWQDLMNIKQIQGDILFTREYLCLKGDTKIKVPRGFKQIKELKEGDMVLTHNGRYKPIIATSKRKDNGQKIKLSFANKEQLIITPEHPILISRDDEIIFVEASDVTFNDYIVQTDCLFETKVTFDLFNFKQSHTTIHTFNGKEYLWNQSNNLGFILRKKPKTAIPRYVRLTSELAELLGWWTAEGSIGAKGKQITFNLNYEEKEEAQRIRFLIKKIFEKESQERERKERGVRNIIVNNKIIGDLFLNLCGHKAPNKKVPEEVMNGEEEIKKSFLKGYFAGDGCLKKYSAEFTTVSNILATGTRRLLESLGIPATISTYTSKENHYIEGRRIVNTLPTNIIRITGVGLNKFSEIIIGRERDVKKRSVFKSNHGRLCLYKVIDKETFIDSSDVYNVEVQDDNTYVTSAGIVHNCRVMSDDFAIFPEGLVDKCTKAAEFEMESTGRPGATYVIGADLASSASKTADYSAFCVLEYDIDKGIKILRELINERLTAEEQEETLISLARKFNNAFVYVEKNNIGEYIRQKLESNNIFCEGFTTSKESKSNAIKFLRSEMANKRLFFPAWEGDTLVLKKQMINFGYKTVRGRKTMAALTGHDDAIDSLWIANLATQELDVMPSACIMK